MALAICVPLQWRNEWTAKFLVFYFRHRTNFWNVRYADVKPFKLSLCLFIVSTGGCNQTSWRSLTELASHRQPVERTSSEYPESFWDIFWTTQDHNFIVRWANQPTEPFSSMRTFQTNESTSMTSCLTLPNSLWGHINLWVVETVVRRNLTGV